MLRGVNCQENTGYPFGGGVPSDCCVDTRCESNLVKDYLVLEKNVTPGDIRLRHSLDVRPIRLENSTPHLLAVAFTTYRSGYIPEPEWLIHPGETRVLGVNPPGLTMQYIWLFNPETNQAVNDPHPVRWHHNAFVIRSGGYWCNNQSKLYSGVAPQTGYGWYWIDGFRQPSIH